MQKMLLAISVLVGLMPPAVASQTKTPFGMEDVLTLRVDGEVVVDSTGRLVSHSIKTNLPDELRAALDKGMAAWEFEPPAQGKEGASTPVRITLAARALSANAFQVRLDNVSFPSRNKDEARIFIANMRSKPEVPLSYRATGIVTIELSVGADGRLIDAAATQCSLHGASGTRENMQKACNEMEVKGLQIVRKWTFRLENQGHQPSYPVIGTIPLYYVGENPDEDDDTGAWRKESRTAYRRPAWRPAEADEPRVGTSDVRDSALVQGDPALRLKDGFIGRVL